jgi:hypothetical protein
LSELLWKKPVICIFKERSKPEVDPFVVVKAKQLKITCPEGSDCFGEIEDFFTLMGDADYLASSEGKTDHYVICWFDDSAPEMHDLRRMQGVTFNGEVTCHKSEQTGKRTYNASFKAQHAKLK